MEKLPVESVVRDLKAKGFSEEQAETVSHVIKANLPPGTYQKAVLFLGWATVVLAAGSILLAGLGQPVPDALWGALGAGIGGLAGIFMGNQ